MQVYNAVVLLEAGKVAAVRYKSDLPNYGVFDEKRVFAAGPLPGPIDFRGVRIGVPICEDIWNEEVCECLAECGAEFYLVPNGSPFDWKKPDVRTNIAVVARGRKQAAAGLCQSARRAGRTGLRRGIVRAQRRCFAGGSDAKPGKKP